ncbi:hypothetical protein SSP35_96_00020, partial [Streptomyces sp. NBRC 110611]
MKQPRLRHGEVDLAAAGIDQPGDMLDQLMRHIEHGTMRNQQGPLPDQPFHPSRTRMKEVQ